MAGLLGRDYSSSQMSYDLRRLRLLQLIERSAGTNSYTLTPDGTRVAVFYTKLHARLLRPLLSADRPPAPVELRHALATVQHFIDDYVRERSSWSRCLKLVTRSRDPVTKKY